MTGFHQCLVIDQHQHLLSLTHLLLCKSQSGKTGGTNLFYGHEQQADAGESKTSGCHHLHHHSPSSSSPSIDSLFVGVCETSVHFSTLLSVSSLIPNSSKTEQSTHTRDQNPAGGIYPYFCILMQLHVFSMHDRVVAQEPLLSLLQQHTRRTTRVDRSFVFFHSEFEDGKHRFLGLSEKNRITIIRGRALG